MRNPFYNILRHYGEIIADKNHETTEGNFIRFTTYKYDNIYYYGGRSRQKQDVVILKPKNGL